MKKVMIPAYILAMVAAVVAFIAGYYINQYYCSLEAAGHVENIEILKQENRDLKERLARMVEELSSLRSENAKLIGELRSLKSQISAMLAELEEKSNKLEEMRERLLLRNESISKLEAGLGKIKKSIEILKDDKELLVVASSRIPDERKEAERFWNDTRSLVERVEPSLLPTVNKILHYLDSYFDWLESVPENASKAQLCDWMFSYTENTEAQQYQSLIGKFRNEIYHLIISHMNDILITAEEVP